MKKILTVLMCTAIFSASFFSCKHDETVTESPEISQTNEDNNFMEDSSYYTGTFNEEVFEHIIQNISMKGIKVSMPCTFSELSGKFELNDSPYVDSENRVVCYTVSYNGERAALIEYDSDRELTKEEQKTETFYFLSINPYISEVKNSGMYAAGLTTNDTYDMIKQNLGEPTDDSKLSDDGKGSVTYDIDDKRGIIFYLRDNKIQSIMIINQ